MTDRVPNVLMVTREQAGDRRYGLGRSLLPVVDALAERGWHVRYLSQEDLPDAARAARTRWLNRLNRLPGVAGAPSRQMLLGALGERLQMGWFAAKVARAEGFTAVHLHDPWLGIGFWLASRVYGLRGLRWGVAEHGFGCYSRATHEDGLVQGPRAQRWLRWLETRTLAAADWVTSPTRLSLAQLARDLALPEVPGHWRAIPHAAPVVLPISRAAARGKLGWTEGEFHVLGVGRLAPLKRFELLVQACGRLAARHPLLHLHILGGGDSANLQKIADDAGLGGRISFDVVDDVWPWLAASDAYVSASATESFGLANLEAMVAGLPCICTATGGVPEVMGTGAWLLAADGDALVGALAEALDTLASQPDQRTALAARAVASAHNAPRLQEVTDRYVELYQA